jgi:MYXO-CTERM domain-containing protein
MEHDSEPETERPHDVLAAEMYAVPAPDPILQHGPLVLPGDLTGSAEPRDVLAAEEFPMPAPPERPPHAHIRAQEPEPEARVPRKHSVAFWALLILLAVLAVRRRRGR